MSKQLLCHGRNKGGMQEEGFGEKPSTLKQKSTKGEIVEVKGGRILRSIGRKDRHSKVCTAKGPRDRRVRLSANTAIQFYDVQDRLGYGRPSEAIDWLMKEAKAVIDALNELPNSIVPSADDQQPQADQFPKSGHGNQIQQHLNEDPIKGFSFFTPSSSRSQTQCFNPSLQSCQNPMLLQPHLSFISSSEPALFSAPTSLSFDESTPSNWPNPQTMEIGRTQRMITWASNSSSGNGEERDGFVIDSMPHWQQQRILDQDQSFSQGGTLQSSYSPSVFSSMNPQLFNLNYDQIPSSTPSSGTGNLFTSDGFSGFCISPQIQGGGEKHIPAPNLPSSATCILHYQHY